jgi:Fe-S-cluster containining protein
MPTAADFEREARAAMGRVQDSRALVAAVVSFHRKLDDVVAASVRGHAVQVDCSRGCHFCCHLPVEVQPAEALALADWLRRHLPPQRLQEVIERLRGNARRVRAMDPEERKRTNVACALLDGDGACSAYEARPAQCRRFHSTRRATCEASHADPANDGIESPEHPVVAHNAAVIIAIARRACQDAGLDVEERDLQLALLEALENPKAERRFRSGKRAFLGEWRSKVARFGLPVYLAPEATELIGLALPVL